MTTRNPEDAAIVAVQIELRVLVADGEFVDPTEVRLIRDTQADPLNVTLDEDIADTVREMMTDAASMLDPRVRQIMWGAADA